MPYYAYSVVQERQIIVFHFLNTEENHENYVGRN